MDKDKIKKMIEKNKLLYLVIFIVVFVLLVVIFIVHFGKNEKERVVNSKDDNNINQLQDTAYINAQNMNKEIDIKIDISVEDGDINYKVEYSPKDKDKELDYVNTEAEIRILMKYNGEKKGRVKNISLKIKDVEKDKKGNFVYTGKYSEKNIEFIEPVLEKDKYQRAIKHKYFYADYIY